MEKVEIGSSEVNTKFGTAVVAVVAIAGTVQVRVTVLGQTQTLECGPDTALRLGNQLRNGSVEARQLVTTL